MSHTGGPSQDEGGFRYPTKIYNDDLGNGKVSSSRNIEDESGSKERNHKQSNGDSNPSNLNQNASLANMLRECAKYVEKGEFNPILYQAMGALHVYTGERAGTAPVKGNDDNNNSNNNANTNSEKSKLRGKFLGKDNNLHKNIASLNLGSIGKKFWNATNNVARPQNSANSSTRTLNDPPAEEGVEWCDEHFVAGCQCKKNPNLNEQGVTNQMRPTSSDSNPNTNRMDNGINNTDTPVHLDKQNFPSKPSFQRPVNPNSNLIANGWISQQRRSKMRIVWKDILASLVEGRKQGEETTLWIQRQIVSPGGKAELEALHQIPMKWLEDVTYVDMYGDFRFTLKVFNVNEEFQFRCRDSESAQNWVLTLRSARDIARNAQVPSNSNQTGPENVERPMHSSGKPMEANANMNQNRSHTPIPGQDVKNMSVKELKSIVHGAGYSSYGLEKADLQRIAGLILSNGNLPKPTNSEQASPARRNSQNREDPERMNNKDEYKHNEEERTQQKREFGVEEQERKRLFEEAAARERLRKQHDEKVTNEKKKQQDEEAKKRQHEEAIARKRLLQKTALAEEERRRYEEAAARDRMKQQYEEKAAAAAAKMRQVEAERLRKQQQEYAAAEERRKKEQAQAAAAQERIRKQQQEQAQAAAAKERIRQQQQEQAQAAAAQERIRQQQQEQWKQQQWQQQQQQKQQQQEQWKQQQWQQQQQQQYHNHQQWNQQHHPQPPYTQPSTPNHQQPGFTGGPPPPQQPRPGPGGGAAEVHSKYAKVIAEEDDGQAAITALKRNILLNWALQPPTFNALKPIQFLVTSIHGVFPPAFNVKGHAYFAKWKPFSEGDLQLSAAMGNTPDEEKLKKAVRKIRFFLHPDKLPKDLDEQQQFMCKMLWDVTSDAWEEHIKKSEELDWIQS